MTEPAPRIDSPADDYGINIEEVDEDKAIYASFEHAIAPPLEIETLRQILSRSDKSDAYYQDDLLQSVVDAYNAEQQQVKLKIGERRDAYCKITVSQDGLKAYLTTNTAYGGRELQRSDIFKAITQAGVRRGVINQCISYALEQGRVDRILVARGIAPKKGKDSEFQPLIVKYRDRRPRIDENGRAHYQDVGNLLTVSAGEALMQRLPPQPGTSGIDVFGNPIIACDGKIIPFCNDLTGAAIDPDNPDLLRATISGQPLIINHGAIVEKTLQVEDVDLSYGNIDFDGSITVSGKIATAMSVIASGDIVIAGTVEAAATLRAGGDIVVQQGVIGRGAVHDDKGDTGKGTAILQAAGNVSAHFIEHAQIIAGQSVKVEKLLAHSDVQAGGEVIVGDRRSKNGHIRGGSISAKRGISAQVLGSPAGVATQLVCGVHQELLEQMQELQQSMEECRSRRRLLEQNLSRQCVAASGSKNKQISEDAIQRTQSHLSEVFRELDQLQSQLDQLKQLAHEYSETQIVCYKKAYPNIDITIADANLKLSEEKGFGHFSNKERQIVFEKN